MNIFLPHCPILSNVLNSVKYTEFIVGNPLYWVGKFELSIFMSDPGFVDLSSSTMVLSVFSYFFFCSDLIITICVDFRKIFLTKIKPY